MTLILYSLFFVEPRCVWLLIIHSHLVSTGTTVLSYVNMVCATLRHSIPKSVVYCQVREAKRSLLDHFFTDLGKMEVSINWAFQCYDV